MYPVCVWVLVNISTTNRAVQECSSDIVTTLPQNLATHPICSICSRSGCINIFATPPKGPPHKTRMLCRLGIGPPNAGRQARVAYHTSAWRLCTCAWDCLEEIFHRQNYGVMFWNMLRKYPELSQSCAWTAMKQVTYLIATFFSADHFTSGTTRKNFQNPTIGPWSTDVNDVNNFSKTLPKRMIHMIIWYMPTL